MINHISLIYEFKYCFLPQRTQREKHVCYNHRENGGRHRAHNLGVVIPFIGSSFPT